MSTSTATDTGTDIHTETDTAALLSTLRAQQARVAGILDGLDDEALRRPVLPSGWSCLGMLQHLTSMTTFWFSEVVHGTHGDATADDDHDEFAVPDHRPADDVLTTYRRDVAAATASVEGLPAVTPPAWWPEGAWGGWRLTTLAEVLVHVLVETSTHAGHLDAVRELLDGAVWDYAEGRPSVPTGPAAAVTT
ncbi:DUF664 domain-containing protein [Kineosporia sp. R_H_3]|uniref:mycothiol transferase n=1 Tax=Kineosporia sp. R_H_3 TaxID=1961848 RepID=UPI000B4BD89F|nr:DUF664 domain-containing protein [Kineosporia sp. R_H_3]